MPDCPRPPDASRTWLLPEWWPRVPADPRAHLLVPRRTEHPFSLELEPPNEVLTPTRSLLSSEQQSGHSPGRLWAYYFCQTCSFRLIDSQGRDADADLRSWQACFQRKRKHPRGYGRTATISVRSGFPDFSQGIPWKHTHILLSWTSRRQLFTARLRPDTARRW